MCTLFKKSTHTLVCDYFKNVFKLTKNGFNGRDFGVCMIINPLCNKIRRNCYKH